MKKNLRRGLLLGLAAAAVLLVVAALALPYLVDANRYRGLIESKAEEALGRDVRLGEIRLSVLPALGLALDDVGVGALPEEGGGDLVTAARLRVGAKLMPLLRGRLEVTSLVLEEPSMVLSRDREGRWNVERLVAREASPDAGERSGSADGGGELSIASLRLTGGRLAIRDASAAKPLEMVLSDIDLELEDYRPGSTPRFELATAFEATPGARLEISGQGGPFPAADGADGRARRLAAEVRLERVTGPLLTDLAAFAGLSLEGAIGDRAFDASGRFDADLAAAGAVELSALEIDGADLVLSRDRQGSWNVQRIASGSEAPEAGGRREIAIGSLRLEGARLTLRDDSAPGKKPFAVVLTGLDVELEDYRPGSASSFTLATGFESSPGARLEVSGGGPLADATGRVQAEMKLAGASGKLLAELARAAGARLEDGLGERPLDASARLDADLASGGRITVAEVTLTGADLDLRRDRDGRWNFELPQGSPASDARPLTVSGLTIDGARIRLRDESVGPEPFDVVLDGLRLELDRLPTDGPAALRLNSTVEGRDGRASLEVSGRLGPLGEGRRGTPVELSTNVRQLPLAVVRPLLASLGVRPEAGTADLEARLTGSFPDAYSSAGSLDLAAAKIATDERTLDLDLGVRFDVAARRGVESLDFAALDLTLGGNTLAFRGSVEEVDAGRRWDLSLAPTRMPGADLASLLELMVADFSMSFSSETPVAIEGRARGLQTADRLPDLSGRLELRGFRLSHPSLGKPIEKVDADVAFEGETVRVTGLAAAVGGSDLAGELTLSGWERPRVTFDLRSRQADLGEVLSAFDSGDAQAAQPEASSVLESVASEGALRVASGSWDTLAFTDLSARVKLTGGVMTLDPLDMKLYDGAFDGKVVADLRVTPVAFEIQGEAQRLDVAPFLAANLEVENALFGRFTGSVQARGAGDDYDAIVKSLTGGGTARVDEGRLGRLDLLATVARISGVLGQRTLASVANRIASESTRFQRLEGKFQLADGTMTVSELILQSPDFGLEGQVRLNLLASTLGGQFQLAFSELLSDSMQREASRAGELFWNPDTGRVVMPLGLAGNLESPAATVDWSGAAQRYATRRATQELTGLLAKALGGGREEKGTAPPPETPAPAASRSALGAEITAKRWGGSILLQDLKLAGVVRGAGIERASLRVTGADGREIQRVDRLGAVAAYLASAADRSAPAEIAWEARVDGKSLVVARFPLRVVVTVFDVAGNAAEATATVEQ